MKHSLQPILLPQSKVVILDKKYMYSKNVNFDFVDYNIFYITFFLQLSFSKLERNFVVIILYVYIYKMSKKIPFSFPFNWIKTVNIQHQMCNISCKSHIACVCLPPDPVHLSNTGLASRVSVKCRDENNQVFQQRPRLHLSSMET